MIIDAHQHFWDRSLPFDYEWLKAPKHTKINNDFLPEDLAKNISQVGVEKTVFVQTQHNLEENRWALKLAEENPYIAGVVGWVDLASPECEEQLLEFKGNSKFVGIRHITQDEPNDDFIIQDDVRRGLKVLEKHGVPFDLLFYVKHLKHAAPLAKEFPNLPMVIDHLAKPRIKEQVTEDWVDNFQEVAKQPNVYCKLSGMVTEADWENWKPADLKPYVEIALEAFTPARCMYGSDWPVCELAASYSEVFNALKEIVGSLSETEQEAIFGETAKSFYDLEV
ncbi:amidohydrolase family protein [bacterium]|jgi:L-fuconolactonase|nr:amidohydrolase family protein [Planctomicrobium sp.]MDB4793138.1 amidohydrolase family protein [bacterium]